MSLARNVELAGIPALTASVAVLATNYYILPNFIDKDGAVCFFSSKSGLPQPSLKRHSVMWMIGLDLIAIYIGIWIGDMINSRLFG